MTIIKKTLNEISKNAPTVGKYFRSLFWSFFAISVILGFERGYVFRFGGLEDIVFLLFTIIVFCISLYCLANPEKENFEGWGLFFWLLVFVVAIYFVFKPFGINLWELIGNSDPNYII